MVIVEECGGSSNDYRGSRRNLDGSSEEISFDESLLGSSTPRSVNGDGLEEEGYPAMVPANAFTSLAATSSIVGDANQQIHLLSDGQRHHISTSGKRSISRSSNASRGPTTPVAPYPMEICHTALLTKESVK